MSNIIITENQVKTLKRNLKENEEGSYMAKQQLFTIATLAYKMWEMMDKGEELEDWMESKIAQSEQSITSVVKAYLYEDYEDESKGMGGLDYDELIIGK
jgi:hypothetical protein